MSASPRLTSAPTPTLSEWRARQLRLVNQLEDEIESIEQPFDTRLRLLRDRIAARLARAVQLLAAITRKALYPLTPAHHSQLTHDANHAAPPGPMEKNDHALIIAAIARVVQLSTRYAWLVIPGFLIAAILSVSYVSRHIAINTDSSKLLSSSLPWRQQEKKLDEDFPQRTDRIIAVIDATTPEAADEAAAALANALSPQSEVIRTVSRPDGGEFFARNGDPLPQPSTKCGATWRN